MDFNGKVIKGKLLYQKLVKTTSLFTSRIYLFLFVMIGLAYLPGLFVPLMNDDSAHHANIALHMYLTGDYVTLTDHKGDYLDKPHLLFWLCALSYKIFGVNSFAYKFPSLLFTILGTYSTYRLGAALNNKETGRLAALIVASSFAYILANNDVRMDAILTASVAFACWQLVEFVHHNKLVYIVGASLGLAMAFSTKGHIGVLIPLAGIFFYILYRRDWRLLINWRWIVLILCFALLISPVVYCYYLQFNLHPEKIVRGRNHIDGVKFILWDQSFERFEGDNFGTYARRDPLFFFHTFLWAFCPWSFLGYMALFTRLKQFWSRKQEWMTTAIFLITLLGISLSGFKLPHYLNIIFPAASIMVANLLLSKVQDTAWIKTIFTIQLATTLLLFVLAAVLNSWAFPLGNPWLFVTIVLLLTGIYIFMWLPGLSQLQKAILLPVSAVAISFFVLNANFYFNLLSYQAGNELAFKLRDKVDPATVYLWKGMYIPSWNFYTATPRNEFNDGLYESGKKIWLLFDAVDSSDIRQSGYELGRQYIVPDFHITKLKLSFMNPATRQKVCTKKILAEVTGRKEEQLFVNTSR